MGCRVKSAVAGKSSSGLALALGDAALGLVLAVLLAELGADPPTKRLLGLLLCSFAALLQRLLLGANIARRFLRGSELVAVDHTSPLTPDAAGGQLAPLLAERAARRRQLIWTRARVGVLGAFGGRQLYVLGAWYMGLGLGCRAERLCRIAMSNPFQISDAARGICHRHSARGANAEHRGGTGGGQHCYCGRSCRPLTGLARAATRLGGGVRRR